MNGNNHDNMSWLSVKQEVYIITYFMFWEILELPFSTF